MNNTGDNDLNKNDQPDDRQLSELYKKLATEQPPGKLDSAILSAAHQAVRRKKVISSPFSSNWAIPLSLAATVILSVSIVITMPEQDYQLIPEQETIQSKSVMPEKIDEQKIDVAAEQEIRKKAKLRQEKTFAKRKNIASKPKGIDSDSGSKQLARKRISESRPAMAPQARSLSLDSAVGSKAESDSIQIKFEVFSKNIRKVVNGVNKRKVLELLGEPFSKKKNLWRYRYIVSGAEKNYIITFKNNLVIKTVHRHEILKQEKRHTRGSGYPVSD